MADYIRREAALKAAEHAYGEWNLAMAAADGARQINLVYKRQELLKAVASVFDIVPAADVEPVVPCKGCEHAERYERIDGTAGYYCGHPQNTFVYGERWDRVFKPVKKPDDFCSFGEPKEGGNENAAD